MSFLSEACIKMSVPRLLAKSLMLWGALLSRAMFEHVFKNFSSSFGEACISIVELRFMANFLTGFGVLLPLAMAVYAWS